MTPYHVTWKAFGFYTLFDLMLIKLALVFIMLKWASKQVADLLFEE